METSTLLSTAWTFVRPRAARASAVVLCLAVVNLGLPMGMATFAPDPHSVRPVPKPVLHEPVSRVLSARDMRGIRGSLGTNPYIAGQNKWDVVYKGVNLLTGNFTTSGTDLTFEGGYGIPVNVTRSYSSNSAEEGPMGYGWSLSVDVRSTAGGLLKGPSAPIRSVPVIFKERPAAEHDANIATDPVEAVTSTDAGGKEETVQKDVDGILTTPPWDKNEIASTYETVSSGGNDYQILLSNTLKTPDGTIYVYAKKGYYTSGQTPYNNTSATATPANVLKIVSATDRQGNETDYTYNTTDVTFTKTNGQTTEKQLTAINMPNGHEIDFTWGNGTTAPTNRIRTASDGVRTVTYGYTSGALTSVTSPAGKVTSYGYGASVNYDTFNSHDTASGLLTSITDPRGLTTSISYAAGQSFVDPYNANVDAAVAYKVSAPNGVDTYVHIAGISASYPINTLAPLAYRSEFYDYAGSAIVNYGVLGVSTDTTDKWFKVRIGRFTSIGATDPSYGFFDYHDDLEARANWGKTYDLFTQDLLQEDHFIYPRVDYGSGSGLWLDRQMMIPTYLQRIGTATSYNFMGKPLAQTRAEQVLNSSYVQQSLHTSSTDYAYWGAEKYYQQKAVKDTAGRYSFTDYYDSSASAGQKGQTYRLYDQKRVGSSGWGTDSGATVPSGTPSGDVWKYNLVPSDFSKYSGQFSYDSKGRTTDVWKIQSTSTTPWTYVQTHTDYGADSSPIWGAATSVIEDYGSGKINRTTQNLSYDSIGRVTKVQDAAGQQFQTAYDDDGVIQSVYRVDGTHNDPIATYTYGSSGILNGMVTEIVDGLSGVTQDFTYQTSGGGTGQLATVVETNGSFGYEVDYSYDSVGDRQASTYTTPSSTTKWKFTDYTPLGDPSSAARAFQTLNKLDGSGNPTNEEFHYQYDSSGRLIDACFAQTPPSGHSGYSGSYPATTRARAYYAYDPAGRVTSVEHYWDTFGSSSYSSTPILGNSCSYELSSLNRGLKTESDFYTNNSGSWSLDHSELYGYDAELDYLTSASYNGGTTSTTWSYDAAGNRNDVSVVDHLNRASTINGVSRTYDELGNTLTIGSSETMTWDVLNHLASLTSSSVTTTYQYRVDGMRTFKGTDSTHYSYFCYDSQMPIETTLVNGATTVITQNGLGARGIEYINQITSSGSASEYPIYDAHGNMIAALAKSGSSYVVGNQRNYGVWGDILTGSSTGTPDNRYCASLGHVRDDESGCDYMRARYYDSSSGRFLSQDPVRNGDNVYAYADNSPVDKADKTGKMSFADILGAATDYAAELSVEFNNKMAVYGFAVYKIVDVLTKWAENLSPELSEALYGEQEFGSIYQDGMRVEITGIDKIVKIAIDLSEHGGSEPHVNTYPENGMPGFPHFTELKDFLTPRQ